MPPPSTTDTDRVVGSLVSYPIDSLDYIQPRGTTDDDKVEDFAEAYAARKEVPPPTVWIVDGKPILVDGNHRVGGLRKAGFTSVECIIAGRGTRKEAVEAALLSNHTNGLHRTQQMKRHYVRLALHEFPERSDRAIAAMCGVSDKLVGTVADELRIIRSSRVGADGRTRRMPSQRDQPVTRSSGATSETAFKHEQRKEARPAASTSEEQLQDQEMAVTSALRLIQIACMQLREAGREFAPIRDELHEAEDRLYNAWSSLETGSLSSLGIGPLHVLIRSPDSQDARSRFVQETAEFRSKLRA